MLSIELQGTKRTTANNAETKQSRANGNIPCVLYGGSENLHFSVNRIAFDKVYISPNVYVVELNIEGKKHKAIVKDIQFHPTTDAPIHVDFLEISDNKPFTIKLPIKLNGVAEGVKQGGKLQQKMRKLKVNGLLKDMPATLDVEISKLTIGQSVKIDTLNFNGLTILDPKSAVICSVNLTRSAARAMQEAANAKK
ncbi:MAG: 50S ribosomal protein L25/general stress protein Ctc [Bacteroidales bacterium]|jgi:large subunit ribosomal protein L25|nr:50S ribosomal protein L25/general stress protein Ctc [Bacteroidales bacterium]